MICPKCKAEQADGNRECTRCGIIFEKYEEYQKLADEEKIPVVCDDETISSSISLKDFLFYVAPGTNLFYLGGRIIVFLFILVWSINFFRFPMESNHSGESFLHLVNLPFHEAGHIIFMPFGRFMSALGGTLGQLLIPLACFFTFLIKTRDTFGASAALWWTGENFLDIAPYINDARDLNLLLLGGVTGKEVEGHDWEFILGKLQALQYDHTIANIIHKAGIFVMILSLLWGGYIIFKQVISRA